MTNLKQLINKSVYGTIGYISSQDDIELLEQYILYNLPVLKEFKKIVVATNYKEFDLQLINRHTDMWEKYFPTCYLIDSELNRGHNFGTADLDNILFDWCKENNEEWLCKSSNDIILKESILNKDIEGADFYYLNGIGYGGMVPYNFDIDNIINNDFYPNTNCYFINVSKCDYLTDKEYINHTFSQTKHFSEYNGKIWEYIEGWSCETFLKQCIERNNLSKSHLISEEKYRILLDVIKVNNIHDNSHKNIMIDGICHFQFNTQPIIEI